jgi:hypothetical protein
MYICKQQYLYIIHRHPKLDQRKLTTWLFLITYSIIVAKEFLDHQTNPLKYGTGTWDFLFILRKYFNIMQKFFSLAWIYGF